MLVAKEKRQTNIAEYVLYMWQLEDLIRAHKFDIDALEVAHIYPMTEDPDLRLKAREWTEGLIKEMKTKGLIQGGHLEDVREVILELNYLHTSLLSVSKDEDYQRMYYESLTNIQDFRQKSAAKSSNDVEVCFNGLYAMMLLGMQNRTISPETKEAMESFKKIIVYLATAWHRGRKSSPDYNSN